MVVRSHMTFSTNKSALIEHGMVMPCKNMFMTSSPEGDYKIVEITRENCKKMDELDYLLKS